jgi:hypothetical protein
MTLIVDCVGAGCLMQRVKSRESKDCAVFCEESGVIVSSSLKGVLDVGGVRRGLRRRASRERLVCVRLSL